MKYALPGLAVLLLALLFGLPLVASLFLVLARASDGAAWAALLGHPQLGGAAALSLFTGAVATGLAFGISLIIVAALSDTGRGHLLQPWLGAMLAVPHVAFGIGFGLLIMPSGLVARLLAPALGWAAPPAWTTTHDPAGLVLALALAAKEAGFLIFVLAQLLARADLRQNFAQQKAAALSLGHGTASIWLRLFLPQLWPQLVWPLVIVFVYAATVVDVALVLGPTQPPTLADLVWSDINSAHLADQARGQAGALALALLVGASLAAAWAVQRLLRGPLRAWRVGGPARAALPALWGTMLWRSLQGLFLLIIALLILTSLAQAWPFPQLWPTDFRSTAWAQVWRDAAPLFTSLALALGTSVTSLGLLLLWLETVPEKHDRVVLIFSVGMLGLPALLIGLGQYHLFLQLGLTGTTAGLFLAHLLPVVAYMFIMLKGGYRASDPRWRDVAAGLQCGALRALFKVKWPLLKGPLLASLAVGFAVSFGQFVPAQLVAAGRFSTLPMEAVTLSSGTNRPLLAAFALLLMLAPLLAFSAAGYFGRARWRDV